MLSVRSAWILLAGLRSFTLLPSSLLATASIEELGERMTDEELQAWASDQRTSMESISARRGKGWETVENAVARL